MLRESEVGVPKGARDARLTAERPLSLGAKDQCCDRRAVALGEAAQAVALLTELEGSLKARAYPYYVRSVPEVLRTALAAGPASGPGHLRRARRRARFGEDRRTAGTGYRAYVVTITRSCRSWTAWHHSVLGTRGRNLLVGRFE